MKIYFKIKIILLLTILFIFLCMSKVLASSLSVNPSTSSVSPGQSFSVTISGNDATGPVNVTVSGGTGTTSIWVENNSQTITVTAGASGSIKIVASASSGNLSNSSGDDINESLSASATVTIIEPKQTTQDPAVVDTKPAKNPGNTSAQKAEPVKKNEDDKKSSDASLMGLEVAEGTLTPEFNADVTEYKLTVPNEITALNFTISPSDSNAEVSIEGNENFVVGENKVTIRVIAEDGTTKEYYINVTRKRTNLALSSLKITYVDKDGNIKELELTPSFDPNILEYKLEDISYLINSLNVEAIANLEGAIVEISGNNNLQEGENIIIVKITMKAEPAQEGEEQGEDEEITYTIKVNKMLEPTFWEKIKNKFKAIFGGVFNWYNDNQQKIVMYSLCACIAALVGLSVYIVIDYNKYKMLVQKIKKIEQINEGELVSENAVQNEVKIEYEKDVTDHVNNIERLEKPKGGKHF